MPILHCPLCLYGCDTDTSAYAADAHRRYLQCSRCCLVFVPPAHRLSRDREKAVYDLHENHVHDPGYRSFLSRIAQPLLAHLPASAQGLDFGCGPGPALAAMLREAGHPVALYDSFYRPDPAPLANSYDFITATEVLEHLHTPGSVLAQLWGLLRVGGVLGVMTGHVRDRAAFRNWRYKDDPTHVCFFSDGCWRWWSRGRRVRLQRIAEDILLLHKTGS